MSRLSRYRIPVIVAIISMLLQGCFLPINPVKLFGNMYSCTHKDSLTAERRDQLWAYSKDLFTALNSGKIDEIYLQSHPDVQKQIAKRDLSATVDLLKKLGSLEGIKTASLLDIIELRVRPIPQEPKSVFCSGADVKSKDTVIAFPKADKTIMVIAKLPGSKLDRIAYIYLVDEGDSLQWVAFDVHAWSKNGKNAEHYLELAQSWQKDEHQYPAIIAYFTAQYFSDSGRNMQSGFATEIAEESAKFQNNGKLESELKWTVDGSEYDIFDIGIAEGRAGLIHYFRYVSHQKPGDAATPKESKKLMAYLMEHFPQILNEYDRFVFEANSEIPTSAQANTATYQVSFDRKGTRVNDK